MSVCASMNCITLKCDMGNESPQKSVYCCTSYKEMEIDFEVENYTVTISLYTHSHMHENYLCMPVGEKRVRIPCERICKIIDGQTVNFLLLDFCSSISKDYIVTVRFLHISIGRKIHGVIFYLQLIGVKSIKQTYFHLHFTHSMICSVQLLLLHV